MCLGEKYEWSDPPLENKANDQRIPPREHAAICYEKEESRLILFGGWSNKWLDDIWQINVSSIVGPPYAVIGIKVRFASAGINILLVTPFVFVM